MFFYLQINVFNVYDLNEDRPIQSAAECSPWTLVSFSGNIRFSADIPEGSLLRSSNKSAVVENCDFRFFR